MKHVPPTTALLSLVLLIGYLTHPALFEQDLIQFPLVTILSVLLPVSFWHMANTGRKIFSLFFVCIFVTNISIFTYSLINDYSLLQTISRDLNKGMAPELTEFIETGVNANKRKLAAQITYQHHGISLPYRTSDNNYALYSPNKQDKENYQNKLVAETNLQVKSMNLTYSVYTTFSLIVIHTILFFSLLIFLILRDSKSPWVTLPKDKDVQK